MTKVPTNTFGPAMTAQQIAGISPAQWNLIHAANVFSTPGVLRLKTPSLVDRDDLDSEWYVLDTDRNSMPLVVPEHCLAIENWPARHPEGFLEWFRENGLSLSLYKIGTPKKKYREASLFEFESTADAVLFKMRWL